MSATADWLGTAVDEAMRPALLKTAEEVVLAAMSEEELPSSDPEVLYHAVHSVRRTALAYWEQLGEDVDWMMDGHLAVADGSRFGVERMTEVAGVLLDQLSSVIEEDE